MAKHLIISGKVQGVGYRAAFEARARALQLSGWVRNRRDGSVEAVIAGAPAAMDEIESWAWTGPALAEVRAVQVTDAKAGEALPDRFEVRATE